MTYLVDANVLSETTKPEPAEAVVNWLRINESKLVISSIVLAEVAIGIQLLAPGKKRDQLEKWQTNLLKGMRVLPWDQASSLKWAELSAKLRKKGRVLPLFDGMIAATAIVHGLTVATRNTRDYTDAGVKVINPFDEQ